MIKTTSIPQPRALPPLPLQSRPRNTSIRKPKPVVSPTKAPKQKNKSVEITRKRRVSIEVKTKFQISSSHMGFLMEEQKTNQLAMIRASVALRNYYEALLSLFSVIYSSSQIITSNIFQCKKQTTGLSGIRFIGILFSIYQFVWNQANLQKLRIMARNVMKMGSYARLFEQKIEFICRKITLNYNMQRRIEMAFLNTKLQSYWRILLNKFKFTDQVQILDDLYETAPQKMAYWDFSYFVNDYLADQNFYEALKESNKHKREQRVEEDTLPHNFTYEFMVIEIFCFHQEEAEREEYEIVSKRQSCLIM